MLSNTEKELIVLIWDKMIPVAEDIGSEALLRYAVLYQTNITLRDLAANISIDKIAYLYRYKNSVDVFLLKLLTVDFYSVQYAGMLLFLNYVKLWE